MRQGVFLPVVWLEVARLFEACEAVAGRAGFSGPTRSRWGARPPRASTGAAGPLPSAASRPGAVSALRVTPRAGGGALRDLSDKRLAATKRSARPTAHLLGAGDGMVVPGAPSAPPWRGPGGSTVGTASTMAATTALASSTP